MTNDKRPNVFRKASFANLFNGLRQQIYRTGNVNVVRNRDTRIGSSTNQSELALNVLGDPYVQSCFSRLVEIAEAAYFEVKPGGDTMADHEAAEFIENTYINVHKDALLESLMLALITGVAAHENSYALNKNNKIIVSRVTAIDPDRIVYSIDKYTTEPQLRIITNKKPFDGELPPPRKIVDYKYYSVRIDNSYGFGVGSQLIDLIDFKTRALELWVKIAERYSTPVKIGNVPDTASAEEVDEFFTHFRKMSENSVFILPPGFELKVQDISASGVESLLKTLIDYCDEQVSVLLLGQYLTGREISNGAQARDAIASKITERKALSLINNIANRLNHTTVAWLTQMNFADAAPPSITFNFNEDLTALGSRLQVAKDLGVNLDMDEVGRMLEVPVSTEPTASLGDRAGTDFKLP